MAIKLPELAPIDYTALDFDSIVSLVDTLIKEHPEYFAGVDDFTQSNAGKFVIDLVSYIIDLLANRIDWVANELTLPTTTQKQNAINLLKLINYRLSLPQSAAATITATISRWVNPFVIPARYSIPAKDLDGNNITFEQFQKTDDGKYIYEGAGSSYEFDTSFEVSPILSQNDLVFYEGTSYQEFYTMSGVNNEVVQLQRIKVEEGSIRVWKITRDANGNVLTKRELTETDSFISPESQAASGSGLPPYKIQTTEDDGAYVVFGETPVVEIFSQTGTDEIMVWYRITKGSVGNITANSINYTTSVVAGGQNVQISFLNTTSASGGSESETIEHAKRYAPLTITTVKKTVNPDDFVILLEGNESILNAIAYGKSNEPNEIYTEYGYRIPPYETWIYTVYDKTGWENFSTYSYLMEMRVGRPYALYGLQDTEHIKFDGENDKILAKLKYYALDNDSANIMVTDNINSTVYIAGDDYVIDLEGRMISRINGGAITNLDVVIVQYYQDQNMNEDYVLINFATGDTQDIPRSPIYTGIRTSAIMSNLSVDLTENTLSFNDFDWPNGDYYIDYENNQIVMNPVYPYLDSRISFGATQNLLSAVNNEFIISFEGLNNTILNADHDFPISTFNGWANVGNGLSISYVSTTYSFKVAIDGSGSFRQYLFTMSSGGIWSTSDLAKEIWENAIEEGTSDPFINSGLVVFADSITFPSSPILTFMSTTEGVTSSVELTNGASYTDLFSISANLNLAINYETGTGEDIDIIELAARCRAKLASLNLCYGFAGQDLPSIYEEKPEILSKANMTSLSTFSMTVSINDTLTIALTGTGGATYDGSTQITFNTVVANSPYDLTIWQEILDLIQDMQIDIDSVNGYDQQDIVKVFYVRQNTGVRIGFRQIDTGSSSIIDASIIMEDDTARQLFQFSIDQSSLDGNLVEAKVSPNSDMVTEFLLRIELRGALGSDAFIQAKANNALHNNTLMFLGFSDDQSKRGTQILQRTLISQKNLIGDASLVYTFYDSGVDQNNRLNLNITSPLTGLGGDGNYVIVVPAGTYNISQLVIAINTAFQTSNFSGTFYDLSDFMICEKQEGAQKIRIRMTDYDTTATDLPNVEITDDDDTAINTKCTDILGFYLNQSMNAYSTIILSYAGDWNSDYKSDNSESTSIIKYLKDKRLISQDYIIKDPIFTTFDFKATVVVAKGFDRELVKEQIDNNIFSGFRIDSREFAQPVASSNILKEISSVEGVEYTTIKYFGKDYQLYEEYSNRSKRASIKSIDDKKAEVVVLRWNPKSAFKITLDGCTVNGVNYDGEYLVTIGNSWDDRDYDSLLNAIIFGSSGTGGLAQAIPLTLGKNVTTLDAAINVIHYNGVFEFYTKNEGPSVYIKIESPENLLLNGYQNFATSGDLEDIEYASSTTYFFTVNIDGGGAIEYEIISPAVGVWLLSDIAAQIDTVLPSTALAGIDETGFIRITSLLGGAQSNILIGTDVVDDDLLNLLGGTKPQVDGSSGYVNCITNLDEGTLNLIEDIGENSTLFTESYGLENTTNESIDFHNYKSTLESSYNEILSVSDNFYIEGSTEVESQKHGIIITYEEV